MCRTILNLVEVLIVNKDVGRKGKRGTWHGQQDSQKGI